MIQIGRYKRMLLAVAGALLIVGSAQAARLGDIATFSGVRSNPLVGYGLVVGLNGTGDSLRNAPFTERAIEGMLERLGIGNLTEDQMRTANTAAVMVTAMLPPFARLGSTIDVVVSSLGDATSLRGGTLIVTPLTGADGERSFRVGKDHGVRLHVRRNPPGKPKCFPFLHCRLPPGDDAQAPR